MMTLQDINDECSVCGSIEFALDVTEGLSCSVCRNCGSLECITLK